MFKTEAGELKCKLTCRSRGKWGEGRRNGIGDTEVSQTLMGTLSVGRTENKMSKVQLKEVGVARFRVRIV